MGMATTVLAFGWNPEIKGILFLVVGFVVLCGSVYLLLATNLGARLGLLVALAALFGWITLLGATWWVNASTSTTLGLQGRQSSWTAKEVVVGDLSQATTSAAAASDPTTLGFEKLPADNPGFGQAVSAADEILVTETKKFSATSDYVVTAVYDKDGGSYPKWGPFDFFAWFHRPHWAIVQVQPVIPQETEPGRAPPTPIPDPSQPPVYVVMLRDLGTERIPPATITLGAGALFALTVLLLHRREKRLNAHLAEAGEPTGPPART